MTKNNWALLVLRKSPPRLLIGQIHSDYCKQCKQQIVVPRLAYLNSPTRSNARGTQDGMNADECVQLDLAENFYSKRI
jgi:hypothetical protein